MRWMILTDKIKALRKRAGLTIAEAAKRGGWAQPSSYHRYEDPSRFRQQWLPMPAAQRLIQAFRGLGSPQISSEEILALTQPISAASLISIDASRDVEVIAVVEAGAWREARELPQEERQVFPAPNFPGFENKRVFALLVRGTSMNLIYPDGSIAFCVEPKDLTPAEGHVVAVVAKKGDLYETTLKELGRDQRGRSALFPRSTDPRHQSPIYPNKVGAESVEIIGVAIGKFEMMTAPKRTRA